MMDNSDNLKDQSQETGDKIIDSERGINSSDINQQQTIQENPVPADNDSSYSFIKKADPTIISTSTVVSSNNKSSPSKWFYLLFILTVIVFILMTALLVGTISGKSISFMSLINKPIPTISMSVTSLPGKVLTPTSIPVPTKEVKEEEQKIKLLESDEITDIEAEVNKSDTAFFDQSLLDLDKINSSLD